MNTQPPKSHSSRSARNGRASHGARDAAELARASAQAPASLWDEEVPGGPLLPDSEPSSAIRDSLYDLIPLGDLELDLIGTPEFVRLQGVKQLGFVYRVWPGATHTRFEHSLGVYYLMLRGIRALRAQNRVLAPDDATDLRTALAAAMLHDIGHYPFSHAIEELGHPIMPHERVGRRLIEGGSVADVLERHGLSPRRVADLVNPPRDGTLPPVDALLMRLLSGPLDVDKLDYLPRDARACNVPYGGVDVTRLLGSLHIYQSPEGARLGVTDKGISPLSSLLHARQEMFDNVYWHHTNRAMMAMLLRAVQDALLEGTLSPDDLPGHDDASLLGLLSGERMPVSTRQIVEGLRLRRPYKVLLEVSQRAGRVYQQLDALFWDQGKRRRVEIALAGALSETLGTPIAGHDVLIDIPKPEKWEMDVQVYFSRPPLGMRALMSWTEATGQRPSDLGIYEQHQRRIRIVAREAVRDAAGDAVERAVLPVLDVIPTL
jgi:HD superfamily phosphohydrolase